MLAHNERCKNCKERVFELLTELFGEVKTNYNLDLSSNIDLIAINPHYINLKNIFLLLQNYRGYENFIRAKKLPNVDFFVINPGFIVEFDETQHFTKPRKIALQNYSSDLELNFDKEKWINLCTKLDKKDNDPLFRDEQRAWYDTMRDYVPHILNLKPTIRLFSKDYIWCELNPKNKDDIIKFKNLIFK